MDLRYPIGPFHRIDEVTEARRTEWIQEITTAPARLRAAVAGLSPEQLATPYREGGWTVRQVVHHLADSHLNIYTRFRLALTEREPVIKPFEENGWAELSDARTAPVELSLALMDGIHARWTLLLESLSPEDWARTFRHPDTGLWTLEQALPLYVWHGNHHIAHITSLRERSGW